MPLFAGFVSKEEVLGAVWTGGFAVPFVMLLAAAFLTAFYMFRVVFLAFFGGRPRPTSIVRMPSTAMMSATPPGTGHGAAHAHDAPFAMTGPLWVLASIAMAIGIYFTLHAAARGVRRAGLADAVGDRRGAVGHSASPG